MTTTHDQQQSDIKFLRLKHGLNQAQLARLIHRSPSHISNVESGRVKLTSQIYDDIVRVLGMKKED